MRAGWRFTVLMMALMFCQPDQARAEMGSEQIREAAGRVMQRHDFRSVRRRVLENIPENELPEQGGFLRDSISAIGDAIGEFLDWVFTGLFSGGGRRGGGGTAPPPAAPASTSSGLDFSFGNILLFIGLAVIIAAAIWIIGTVLKANDGGRRAGRDGLFDEDGDLTDLATPPGELAASTYEPRALQLAQDGQYRLAVRELLLGSMSWIERAGMIRFRKGLTNRDYLRAVWRQDLHRNAFGITAQQFERIYFGRRVATREMFNDCLHAFQGAFREEAASTSAG
ncbi:MAG: DUF4129 domain-containing protein [Planctomycetaceae bacterium]